MRSLVCIGCGVFAIGLVSILLNENPAHGQGAPTSQPAAAPLFSEDFESGELKADTWDQRTALGGSMKVQSDVVAHGKNALMISYPTASGNMRPWAFAVAKKLPETLKEHFFGRAYVQCRNPIPAGHAVFITAGTEGWPVSTFMEIGNRQNKAQLSYQQNGANVTRGETMIPGPAYPTGKWFCLEWEFNDHPDSLVIWIDGEEVLNKKVGYKEIAEGDQLVKGFAEVGVGFRCWNNVANGYEVYYDDIAFGTSRIGLVK